MRAASSAFILLLSARAVAALPTTTTTTTHEELLLRNVVDAPPPFFFNPTTAVIPRFLQSSGTGNTTADSGGGTADPDVVCESLNGQLKGQMTCACDRYGKRGVSVRCDAVVDTCNADNTYCARLSTQYYTDDKAVPIVMTSCTNLTTPGITDRVDSCVQVFPVEAGNFTTLTKCYATLNDQSCGCSVCDASQTVAVAAAAEKRTTGAAGTGAGVSVDCCRFMDGARATCLPVASTGPVAVQYDQVSDEQQCKATSAGARAGNRLGVMAAGVGLLLAISTNLLYTTKPGLW
jgi:hypothetical protein